MGSEAYVTRKMGRGEKERRSLTCTRVERAVGAEWSTYSDILVISLCIFVADDRRVSKWADEELDRACVVTEIITERECCVCSCVCVCVHALRGAVTLTETAFEWVFVSVWWESRYCEFSSFLFDYSWYPEEIHGQYFFLFWAQSDFFERTAFALIVLRTKSHVLFLMC